MIAYALGRKKYHKALQLQEKKIKILESAGNVKEFDLFRVYSEAGETSSRLGKYEKSLTFYDKALEIGNKILHERHPLIGEIYFKKGKIHSEAGQNEEKLMSYKKALKAKVGFLNEDSHEIDEIDLDTLNTIEVLGSDQEKREFVYLIVTKRLNMMKALAGAIQ